MRKRPLAEQVVVVSGGSSGVGRAVVRLAAGRGARVVVAARGPDGIGAAVREAEALGAEALGVTGDVASVEDCERLLAESVSRFGRVDSIVAAAFASVYAEFERVEPDELRRVLDVNFHGKANLLRAGLPHLRASRGTFVDVNSALAYRGIPLQSGYCASKAAFRTLLESARTELERDGAGVDLSVLLPGAIDTPHFDRVRQKLGLQPMPVPPIYEPEVIAAAALHCCERPIRELPVTWGGQKLLWGQKLAPRVVDAVLRRTGWDSQTTGEPKPVGAPDNLFDVLPGDPGERGRFSAGARRSSAWTSARLAAPVSAAILGLVAPAAAGAVAYWTKRRG